MEANRNESINIQKKDKQQEFKCPECRFAATCRQCDHYSGGWCHKHGGWVDGDKWACGSFS